MNRSLFIWSEIEKSHLKLLSFIVSVWLEKNSLALPHLSYMTKSFRTLHSRICFDTMLQSWIDLIIYRWLILRRKYTNFFRIRLLNSIFTTPIIRYKLIHLKRVQTITNKSYIFQDTCVILQKTVVMLSWTMITMLGVQLLFIGSVTNVTFMATLSWTGFVPWNFVIRLEVLSHWHVLKVLKKMITWRIG